MDGLESLALAYGWPPAIGRAFELDEWREWVSRAHRVLRQRAQR